MIAAVGLGALVGGVLFALVLHLAHPRPAPLVELARFDAAHNHTVDSQVAVRSNQAGRPPRDCRPWWGRGWPGN